MNGSSASVTERLESVRVHSVCHLLTVVGRARDSSLNELERAFREGANSFEHVTTFLVDIGWLEAAAGSLQLTKGGKAAYALTSDDVQIRRFLLEAITHSDSPYRRLVASYVSEFRLDRGELRHRPSMEDRLETSSIRDLLMDLRVVNYRRAQNGYVLAPANAELYVWSKAQPSTASWHRTAQAKQDELGQGAELAILEYEKSRLGQEWWPYIEHISASSPFACYDIKSLTIHDREKVPRYIEVKAVPKDTLQFYWSKTELDIAQLLGAQYFLYLLPVSRGEYQIEYVQMLQDPYRTVYGNRDEWRTEENVIVCSRRQRLR